MRRLISGLVLILCLAARADEASFQKLCAENGLRYIAPAGYQSVPPPDYGNYCLTSGSNRIVYAVRPLKEHMEAYRQSKLPGSQSTAADPNKLYPSMLMVMAANTGGLAPDKIEMDSFKPEDVKAEFGADAGMLTVFLMPDKSVCLLTAFHKTDLTDFYIYFFTPDKAGLDSMISDQKVFRALQFK